MLILNSLDLSSMFRLCVFEPSPQLLSNPEADRPVAKIIFDPT